MVRETGQYVKSSAGAESYRAFVPNPLPPDPPLSLDGELLEWLEKANRAIGRLDGVSEVLPNSALFLYQYVRKEALLSSQIEGTQSSFSDLLLFEFNEVPGVPTDDVEEVSNYVAAMYHGLTRLDEGFPLSLRLLREIHEILLRGGRGATRQPGEFRRIQNWLGGSRPGNAIFVPPPPDHMMECLDSFERFLHDQTERSPVLIKAGLIHVQFETIHPFLDGNGRLGRLLITLLLVNESVLSKPLLYLSLFIKMQREKYYHLLQNVRLNGDWESWLRFFLQGIYETAQQAVETARALMELFEKDRMRIKELGRISGSCLQLHDRLQNNVVVNIPDSVKELDINRTTIRNCMGKLIELGIVAEVTGKKRNQVFVYQGYADLLSEGTEPL